jgi:hypothetical protein
VNSSTTVGHDEEEPVNATARNCELLTLAALVLLAALPAAANTYNVDRLDDSTAGACTAAASDCGLRGAILTANAHNGDDIVVLGSGTYTLSIAGRNEDLCQTGDLDVRDTVRISGTGPEHTVIDAGGIDRVLHVIAPGERLSVHGVTITGGDAGSQSGGGIFLSQGTLRVQGCLVAGNTAPSGSGGGLYDAAGNTASPVEIVDTWFVVNSAVTASAVYATSRLVLERSTVSSNSSASAGMPAVNILGANSVLRNSTITSNTSPGVYGGVEIMAPDVSIIGCTLADNSGTDLAQSDPYGTILANNVIIGTCESSAYVSLGGNLESPGDTCGLGASDLVNVVCPMLGQLDWCGGVAPVLRPMPGSPAIDQPIAAQNCPTVDQRGLSRPRDGGGAASAVCDIGAVELAAAGEIFIETFEAGYTTSWSQVVP